MQAKTLLQRVRGFSGRELLVLGDPVVDRYILGSTHRISREAPVLIVREDESEARLGGAANTAANLAALGAKVSLLGLVGDDPDRVELERSTKSLGIRLEALAPDGFRTIVKTRILAGALHTRRQQMLRIDRGPREPFDPKAVADEHQARAEVLLHSAEALIISDYSEGYVMTPLYRRVAEVALRLGKPVIVDSRSSIHEYPGVTAVTPNEPEIRTALGSVGPWSAETALASADQLRQRLGCGSVLLTRGREGMAMVDASGRFLLAAHGPAEAVDVTGAGDTVVAAFTLALSAGASTAEAAVIANCAASVTVQQTGAATVSPAVLLETLATFDESALREVPR
jgi:rfaE bifunctional protein kinase chain/domain